MGCFTLAITCNYEIHREKLVVVRIVCSPAVTQTSSVCGYRRDHILNRYLNICTLCFALLQVTSRRKAMKRNELNFWPRSYHRPKVRLTTQTSCLIISLLLSVSSFLLHAKQCHHHTDLSRLNDFLQFAF